jgi:Bacterial dipeptidyl-peptidase Sh3 domain/NlpC/P60 family
MMQLDPRVTPARADLAAAYLRGAVEADRFVEGVLRQVIQSHAPLRREPSPDAMLGTEALKGERVTVYDETDEGWCWGQLQGDGYVGWLPAAGLGPLAGAPTHRVAALRTLVFPGPSIRLPPLDGLSLGCCLAVDRVVDQLAVCADGGFVPARHLADIDAKEPDFVAVAERFVGVPYLWGGKTSLGLDCSGLVQLALTAAGIACPRDSDMQENSMGERLAADAELRRGDLVFWKGHVAIARDRDSLVHANAFHMAVAIEPLSEAAARINAAGGDITSVRRIDQ